MNFESLSELIKQYNYEEINFVTKAYRFASKCHEGVFRKSGEPYIIHPLSVAYILAEMKADGNTLCAALLHDVVEDTDTTLEDIEFHFNKEIADLVDGVTKISGFKFNNKDEKNNANQRKIITSLSKDVRVVIIKLADRLHNMRTLEFMSDFKKVEISLETLELFVPLAYFLGAYKIKSELEDLSLQYVDYQKYRIIKLLKADVDYKTKLSINNIINDIKKELNNADVSSEIKPMNKNIYGIYKRFKKNIDLESMHDLHSIIIMVDSIQDCYKVFNSIKGIYNIDTKWTKDYISRPKTNNYQSIHTTIKNEYDDNSLLQLQIRTKEMDNIAMYGLPYLWDIKKENARFIMQKELEKYQFYDSLISIDNLFSENELFIDNIKREVLAEKIYVYDKEGYPIELPKGSTCIDFAYKKAYYIGDHMNAVYVNGKKALFQTKLNTGDIVEIMIKESILDLNEEYLLDSSFTTIAKNAIRRRIK